MQQPRNLSSDVLAGKRLGKGVISFDPIDSLGSLKYKCMIATDFHTDDTSCQKSPGGPYSQQANELHGASETKKETTRNTDEDDSSGKNVRGSYHKSAITNDGDFKIRAQLDEADDLLKEGFYIKARYMFDSILRKHPQSPLATVGLAAAFNKLAHKKKSPVLLDKSIEMLKQLLTVPDVPDELMITAGSKLAELQAFRGRTVEALKFLPTLADKYPKNVKIPRRLGDAYASAGWTQDAKRIFQKILKDHPSDGFAMVHLGQQYVQENEWAKAVPLLKAGIGSDEEGTQQAVFYASLGFGLHRQGRNDEAQKVFRRGTDLGLFPSVYQHSISNVRGLTGRPWWTPVQTGYQEYLEVGIVAEMVTRWFDITIQRSLVTHNRMVLYKGHGYKVSETGVFLEHKRHKPHSQRISNMAKVSFNLMYPGTELWRHSGPTNYRITAILGLDVDEGAKLQVVNKTRTMTEGKIIIFDDSFEHAAWYDGKSLRLVFIVDFWHPELSESMRRHLSST
ncbi:hypothetical protein BaRGS_00003730 [Batillaria attramentaria]|uniref:Aspartyl/asparaginy/proline hydroxylase domain-containing protein n=1 Tax=Batillaria attramentaria TaxID=370345 RepID=A0ABD0LZX1_9CAEN